jgi:hypothetical protein
VLLVYGEESANAALIGELEQDGYQVRRASHARTLAERCEPGQVDLVTFGMTPARDSKCCARCEPMRSAGRRERPGLVDEHEQRDDDRLAARSTPVLMT